jgi:hypothetical protein
VRHLYDWLVTGQVVPTTPAASARGPRHVVRSAKTSVLEPVEARRLLLGHRKRESTVRSLGIEIDDAQEMAEPTEV